MCVPDLGVKCTKLKVEMGGRGGGVSYMLRHPLGSAEWGVRSRPDPCMILLTTSRERIPTNAPPWSGSPQESEDSEHIKPALYAKLETIINH